MTLCEHDGDSGGGLDAAEDTDAAREEKEDSGGGRFKLDLAVFRLRVFSDRSTGSSMHSADCDRYLR
jgi:hypothetical protein